jgi:acyl-coenzyme A thioesterase PaaI-like protein
MNIERVAVNTTIFNQIATNLAFYMVKHFEKEVLGEQRSFKSRWGELAGRIKKVKEERMAMGQIRHKLSQEEEMVKDYGIIHGSIVMVAFACNQLRLDR